MIVGELLSIFYVIMDKITNSVSCNGSEHTNIDEEKENVKSLKTFLLSHQLHTVNNLQYSKRITNTQNYCFNLANQKKEMRDKKGRSPLRNTGKEDAK